MDFTIKLWNPSIKDMRIQLPIWVPLCDLKLAKRVVLDVTLDIVCGSKVLQVQAKISTRSCSWDIINMKHKTFLLIFQCTN